MASLNGWEFTEEAQVWVPVGGVRRGAQSDSELKNSFDRKVSPIGTLQRSIGRWVPRIGNGFGLTAGDSCPDKTEFCEGCYAAANENMQGVKALVSHNLKMLVEAGTVEAMADLLGKMVARYLHDAYRANLPVVKRIFRIHWDGDFFSEDYAKAWAIVIPRFPSITFWAYTRSFRTVNVVPHLVNIPNMVLYLSVDAENVEDATEVAANYPSLLIAGCAEDYRRARELVQRVRGENARPIICPENRNLMPLMDKGVGACAKCRLCPEARADILFSKAHVEDVLVVEGQEVAVHIYADRKRQYKKRPGKVIPPRDDYTREEIVECLRRLIKDLDRVFTTWDIDYAHKQDEGPSSKAVELEFGSIPAAREWVTNQMPLELA